jgi:hypothetical protein
MRSTLCVRTCLLRILGIALWLHFNVVLAEGGPPMLTDDPGTPGDGHWEINTALLSDHYSGATVYQVPLIDANYGVGERLQLKFEMPWLVERGSTSSQSAAGNALAGVKWRFYDEGDQSWQMSTYPQVQFGFPINHAVHNDLTAPGTNVLLPIELERAYDGFELGLEAGRWLRAQPGADTWIAGMVVEHGFDKRLSVLAEVHDERALASGRDELIANVGARWNLSADLTVLLSAGRDLHNTLGAFDSMLTYVGMQIRY